MVRIINWTLWLEAIDAATNQGARPSGTSGQIGDLRTAFIGCGGPWKPGWGPRDGASSSKCCG
jgi:hypothetical protein